MVKRRAREIERGMGRERGEKGNKRRDGCIGHATKVGGGGFDSHRGVSLLVIIHLSNRSVITI